MSAPSVSFADRLRVVSVVIHVFFALSITGVATILGAPEPWIWGAAGAALAGSAFPGRLRAVLWDRPRGPIERFVDEPYFVHWCAALGAAFPIALGIVAWPLVCLGMTWPIELPLRFAAGCYGVFLLVSFYGVVVRRRRVHVRRLDIAIRDLPLPFDGYRIAQLSDLHIGGLLPRGIASHWLDLVHREAPDLVVVTGDVVSSGVLFHGEIADILSRLRAPSGVMFSPGNHDYFDIADLSSQLTRGGVSVMRNTSVRLERDGHAIRLAAVDDTWTGHADLELALALHGELPTVLLAHDPDLFEDAVRLGADLVLSGHTHGGQVALPFFARWVNPSRLRHVYTLGRYQQGDATLYVHAGLGTTGPPIRIGVAPEIAILTLRRARSTPA